jgi:hypothetical protein
MELGHDNELSAEDVVEIVKEFVFSINLKNNHEGHRGHEVLMG